MKPFDPNRPVQTRDGRKAEILRTGLRGDYPIAAIISNDFGDVPMSFTANGKWYNNNSEDHPSDLINIPQKAVIKRWMNIYPDNEAGGSYENKAEADDNMRPDRIACVELTGEYEV